MSLKHRIIFVAAALFIFTGVILFLQDAQARYDRATQEKRGATAVKTFNNSQDHLLAISIWSGKTVREGRDIDDCLVRAGWPEGMINQRLRDIVMARPENEKFRGRSLRTGDILCVPVLHTLPKAPKTTQPARL